MKIIRKNKRIIFCLFSIHIFYAFLYIYQYSLFINTSHIKYQKEEKLNLLNKKKEQQHYIFSEAQKRNNIKKFAFSSLGMKLISLKQVKKIKLPQLSYDAG